MDTKKDSSVSDVPTFKVARVGSDRKRKGGGFSFLRGGGSRGAWSGATGGSGAAGGAGGALGMNFSKVMLTILMTATVGSGAVYLGARSAANVRSGGDKKPQIFSGKDIKIEGDTSNLPSNSNTIPNSLGYLTGSRDGLTPEERAKKEAEAAAAAEAQRLADEEAAKKAEAENAAGKGVDPNALLASAKADGGAGAKGSAFGKKFGSLSSSMGGGSSLSGGAGLSGGVNRSFGGAGSLGKGASAGKLAAMKGTARPSYSKAGGARMASSKTKGFARKQLANANAYSRRASSAGKGETAATDAGTAFDNNPGAGNVISGPGVGKGSGSSTGADSTPNSVDSGGPTGNAPEGPVDCGPNNYLTADGGCAPINTGSGKDAKPALTMMANIAMGLLLLIGIISTIVMVVRDTVIGAAIGEAMASIILVLGVIVTGLGVAMMAMGDYVTGGIATLVGGITSYMAYTAPETLTIGEGMVAGFGGAALTMVGKMLDAGNHKEKAPVAAQQ
ncbi:MAG: hypothetical protein HYV14_03210 [Elusimicrobia bacterium]|nr:hypothetical protein [Elusimicrobiota bacterium]